MAVLKTDLDLMTKDLAGLTSPDALTAFLSRLGFNTSRRTVLTPASLGLSGDTAAAIRSIELLAEDEEGFLRVLFAQPRSLTAKVRNDLVRVLGKSNVDHLLILASDFDTLEFVLLDKRKTRSRRGRRRRAQSRSCPRSISVNRRKPTRLDLRTLRRFTWTRQDALDQFDKLRSVFDAAVFTGEYFQNRGLFSDYFLRERLREDPAWRDNPSERVSPSSATSSGTPRAVGSARRRKLGIATLQAALRATRLQGHGEPPGKTDQTQPDYLLKDATGAHADGRLRLSVGSLARRPRLSTTRTRPRRTPAPAS